MSQVKDEGLKYNELTIEEQDLISTIRRIEANFGQAGLVAFAGGKDKQEFVGGLLRKIDEIENSNYDGVMTYLVFKIPTESFAVLADHAEKMHTAVQSIYVNVANSHFPEELGGQEEEVDG